MLTTNTNLNCQSGKMYLRNVDHSKAQTVDPIA